MATFVLVHGAWHGGWCWARTEAALCDLGHAVHAPTLTGLGERSHLMSAEITADLHVLDIVNTLKWRELEEVILVGHSYGGLIITGAASAAPERLSALVYLDAFVPEQSGVSPFEGANPERMAAFRAQAEAGAAGVLPDKFDAWSDDPAHLDWLKRMCTPHPWGTFEGGVTLTGREAEVARRHYILAARNRPSAFWGEYERVRARPDWSSETIDAKHDVMVDAPEALAKALHGLAGEG